MSLLTRCPACTTIYRVVPDQLRISQGWVKCGQCGDIFDATQHLVQIEQAAAPATPSLPVEETPPDVPLQEGGLTDDVARLSATADVDAPVGESFEASSDAPMDVQTPSQLEAPSSQPLSSPGELPAAENSLSNEEPPKLAPMRESAIDPEPDPEPEAHAALEPEVNETVAEMADVSFLRDASKADGWRRPWVRAVLVVLATLLAGLLLGQWIFQQRHVLAARWPEFRLALKVACDAMGCELQPVQRIESVLIDSATFNQLGEGRFLLSCVLKNTAELPLAAPSVELTLNDLQDRTVVRRVFSADELDAGTRTLLPLAEWRVSVPLALTLPVASPQVVGYRVRVFYP